MKSRFAVAFVLLAMAIVPLAECQAAQVPASSSGRGECLTVRSEILNQMVPYCVLLPPSYDAQKTRRYPVLYFLHGLGDDEQSLFNSGGWNLIQDLWQRREIGEFLIVTPRGGSSFYINSQDGRYRYEDFLVREFLPAVEKRYRIRPGRQCRAIAGISMGGYGALHMAFHHPELFASVAVHSAVLIEKLPPIAGGNSPLSGPLALLGDAFGSPLDRAFWDTNNPLTLAHAAILAGLKIYFDCGLQDDFGFESGAQALHNILASRHIFHDFHLYPGGHNWGYFSAHLPASLEFVSRSLGLEPSAAK